MLPPDKSAAIPLSPEEDREVTEEVAFRSADEYWLLVILILNNEKSAKTASVAAITSFVLSVDEVGGGDEVVGFGVSAVRTGAEIPVALPFG